MRVTEERIENLEKITHSLSKEIAFGEENNEYSVFSTMKFFLDQVDTYATIIDKDSKVRYINTSLEECLNINKITIKDVICPICPTDMKDAINTVLNDKKMTTYRKDHMECTFIPLIHNGSSAVLCLIKEDIYGKRN